MRMRFRGGRGREDIGGLSTGESRGSNGNPPGTTAFWITLFGLLGGAVVRDLSRPDSRIRAVAQSLLHPGKKLIRPAKVVRLVEGHSDEEKVIETVN
jgi:hypothetical protein